MVKRLTKSSSVRGENTMCCEYWEHGPSHSEHVRARVRLQSAAVPASQQGAQHVASIPSVAAAAVGAAVAVAAATAAT